MRGDSTPARAILFDFDGVLVDDERLHWRASRAVLGRLGIPLTRSLYNDRYLAFDDHTAFRSALSDAGWPAARRRRKVVDDLVREKRLLFRRLAIGEGLGLSRGVRRVVRALAARMPLAVVSGAARFEVLETLRRARLLDRIAVIVAAEDVRRCKPSPEGYRQALRRLGLTIGSSCLAIEDSPGGIAAARAAGIRTLGVASSYGARALRRAGAFEVVPTLDDATRVLRILRRAMRRDGA